MTEDENEVGAAALLTTRNLLIHATNALSEWAGCRGGKFEPEGSLLSQMTEGKNEVGAADLLMNPFLTSVRQMLCQNEGAVKWPS